jgi:GxxExxY protein
MLRIASPRSEDLEHLVHDVIGCCVAVPRELGPGLLESVYASAVAIELQICGISFEVQKAVPVSYRGRPVWYQRLDVLVDSRVVLELKSVEQLHPIHVAQVISYLRVTRCRIGLLVNFNVPTLKQGVRRVVL